MIQANLNMVSRCRAFAADKRLDDLYGRYRKRLDAKQRELLKQAQLAWLRFRTDWCKFVSSGVEGGSAYPMVANQCYAKVTEARVSELEVVSTCKEGDLGCPAW